MLYQRLIAYVESRNGILSIRAEDGNLDELEALARELNERAAIRTEGPLNVLTGDLPDVVA